MEQQQSFSPGLLYSIAPENFAQLHLHDDEAHDGFEWDEYESRSKGESLAQAILSVLKITAAKWKLSRP